MGDAPGAATFRGPVAAYDRHVGRYSSQLGRAVVAAAGVRRGQRALDVGCGPGALTCELVAVLGAERVAAVDPSEPFVAACRERLPGVDVRVAPAEDLPFDDAAFDHALCQLVLNFMTDAPAGLGEMQRVIRPGGTIGAAVWDYVGEMTLLRRFWEAVVALDPTAADRDEGRSMPYCTPAALRALFVSAGLEDVDVTPAVVTAEYTGFTDLWQPFEGGMGPAGAYAAGLDPEPRATLREELRRLLGVDEQPFSLSARAWIATGARPPDV